MSSYPYDVSRPMNRILALVLAAGCATTSSEGLRTDVPIDLTLPVLGKAPLELSGLRGQVVLLDVMATWSIDSQAAVPVYERLLASYGERGLAVVSIAFDSHTPQLVRTWKETLGATWPVALATPDVIEGRSPLGPIPEIPRTLILDRKGYVRFQHSGTVHAATLAREIESLL